MYIIKKTSVVVLTVLIIGVLYINSPYKAQSEIRTVHCTQAESIEITDYLTLRGNVVEQCRRELYPKYTSRIESITVRPGEHVSKGQALMTLRVLDNENDLAVFYGEIRARLRELDPAGWEVGFPERTQWAGETYDLISPMDGTVMDIYCKAGESVSGIFPCIAVSDLTQLGIEAQVSEENSGKIQAGTECRITVSSASEDPFSGVITSVAPYAAAASILEQESEIKVTVMADIRNSSEYLRPGYSAEVRVDLSRQANCTVVPYNCIAQDDDGEYILSADSSGRLYRAAVQTGRELTNGVEILSGISAGTLLIETPEAYTEGERVRLQ